MKSNYHQRKENRIEAYQNLAAKNESTYGQPVFSLRNYAGGGWVSLWNGKPKNSTSYA